MRVATFWWENVFEKPRGSLNYLRKVQLSSQTRFSLEFSGQSYVNNVCVFLCFVCLNIYGPSSIIKILTWLQGFLVIDLYLVWFSLCSGLFWESQDNGVMKNLPFCLWSLGVILEQTYPAIVVYWWHHRCYKGRGSTLAFTRMQCWVTNVLRQKFHLVVSFLKNLSVTVC